MVSTSMVGRWPRWRWSLILLGLVVAGLSLFAFSGARSLRPGAAASRVARPAPAPRYTLALTLAPDTEWRFTPRALDLNGDGLPDLVATARLTDPALHIWWGDGHTFTPAPTTWTNIGYGAIATGDLNHDGIPDIIEAGHFGKVQTLLSDGQGGFTETIMQGQDGYVAAQLADVNGDGELDLILVGFQRVGIEIYRGDGHGHWTLHQRLPDAPPGRTVPGRDLVLGDLNHDGHVDIVAAFNRWGLYIYYGDGQGGFTGGPVDFISPQAFGSIGVSLALGDVNHDGHVDLVINGTFLGLNVPNGPDVYLGDGHGGWTAALDGLKVLKLAAPGLALWDLDQDGHLDLIAGGNITGEVRAGQGLFWFKGDGKGGWQLQSESGLPSEGLPIPHGVTVADLDRDGIPEIIALHGGGNGMLTVWKRQEARVSARLPMPQAATN
jgi:FG-GAP-like repeat